MICIFQGMEGKPVKHTSAVLWIPGSPGDTWGGREVWDSQQTRKARWPHNGTQNREDWGPKASN